MWAAGIAGGFEMQLQSQAWTMSVSTGQLCLNDNMVFIKPEYMCCIQLHSPQTVIQTCRSTFLTLWHKVRKYERGMSPIMWLFCLLLTQVCLEMCTLSLVCKSAMKDLFIPVGKQTSPNHTEPELQDCRCFLLSPKRTELCILKSRGNNEKEGM